MSIPVGLGLYSVRDDCRDDLAGTVAAVARMGYDAVEFAGYYGRSAGELRKMLDDVGLACCGTHIKLDTLLGDELDRTVAFNRELGNRLLIVPSLPPPRRQADLGVWLDNARLLSELAERLRPHGMRVGYHNHNYEFVSLPGGQTPFDVLFAHAASDVVMQLDTGNCADAGADPVALLRRYGRRAATVHLKGYSSSGPDKWTFVGEGQIDWAGVLAACRQAGRTEWLVVEHETYPIPPLACAEKCLRNLRSMG